MIRCCKAPLGRLAVLGPRAYVIRSPQVDTTDVVPLPNHIVHRVGFCRIATHYTILKMLGETDILNDWTRTHMEKRAKTCEYAMAYQRCQASSEGS